MQASNYYIPYCERCGTYVKPQVVAETHVGGGPQFISSSVVHKKFCPNCGEQVFSQEDRHRRQKEREAEIKFNRILGGILLTFFAGIPALILVFCICGAILAFVFGMGYMGFERMTHMNEPDKRILLFQTYAFGGFIVGVVLSTQYIVFLIRRISRWPWSIILGISWLFLASGLALVWFNAKPGHMESPALTLATYCLYISPGLYWLSTVIFWINRKRRYSERPSAEIGS